MSFPKLNYQFDQLTSIEDPKLRRMMQEMWQEIATKFNQLSGGPSIQQIVNNSIPVAIAASSDELDVNGVKVPPIWNFIDGYGLHWTVIGNTIQPNVNFDPTNGAPGTIIGAAIANTIGPNTTNFSRLFTNGSLGAINGCVIPSNGWLKNLCCCGAAMPQGSAFQLALYRNGGTSPLPLSLVIPPGQAAGSVVSTNQYVYLNAGDIIQFSNFAPGGGTGDIGGYTLSFVGDDNSQPIGWDSNGATGTSVAASTTRYLGLFSNIRDDQRNSAEVDIEVPFAAAGTVTKLLIYTTSAQSANNSLVFTVRKGAGSAGAMTDQTMTVTIPLSGHAGLYGDFQHPFSVSIGDRVTIKVQNNATGASATIVNVILSFVPTVANTALIGGVWSGFTGINTTTWMAPLGGAQRASIPQAEIPVPRPGTFNGLYIYNPYTTSNAGHQIYTLLLNGAPTTTIVDLSASTVAGVYSDIAHPFSVVRGDRISLQRQNTDAANNNNSAGWSAVIN